MQESAPTSPEAAPRAGWRIPALALAAVAILALAVRLWGLGWQLPWQFHPDEGHYTWKAIDLISQETLNPKYFRNPSLFTYVLLAEYRLLGFQPPKADEQAATADGLFRPPSGVAFVGRLTSALMGVLTVLAIGWIGWRALGPWTGVLGALFLALAFIHVRDSHYATNDVPSVLLLTLSVGGLAQPAAATDAGGVPAGRAVRRPRDLDEVQRRPVRRAAAGGARDRRLAAWKAPCPHPALSSQGAPLSRLAGEGRMLGFVGLRARRSRRGPRVPGGHAVHGPGLPEVAGRLPHPGELRRRGLGGAGEARPGLPYLLALGAGWAGSCSGWRSSGWCCCPARPAVAAVLAAFPSPTCSSCSARSCSSCDSRCRSCRSSACSRPWPSSRWREVAARGGRAVGLAVGAALTLVALAQPTLDTVRHNVLIGQEDTRVLAARWALANVPPGAKLAVEEYTIRDRRPRAYGGPAWQLDTDLLDVNQLRRADPTAPLRGSTRYFMISSFQQDRFAGGPDSPQRQFYEALASQGRVVARFAPGRADQPIPFDLEDLYSPFWGLDRYERPGPTITVYELTTALTESPDPPDKRRAVGDLCRLGLARMVARRLMDALPSRREVGIG